MLPALDGLSILKTLGSSDRHAPVIILSALGEVGDQIQVFPAACNLAEDSAPDLSHAIEG